ncbi:Lipoprotein signal peptidase [Geobacillus sp. BCO2]|nr:Lipoprotein signal peptidase [Geobacillus sp. BCO2]
MIYIRRLKPSERLAGVGLGLMLGGAVGNFIDRVFRKEVVDFIHTHIGTYSFPVFNVADSALTVGVILLFVHMFFSRHQRKGMSRWTRSRFTSKTNMTANELIK